jgi:hypothetical protein
MKNEKWKWKPKARISGLPQEKIVVEKQKTFE